MSDAEDFKKATRRLLFPKEVEQIQEIPGAGTSAAAASERHTRVKVTINLDGEVVQYFKDWAGREGRPYQSLVNQVLREFVSGSRPERLAQQVKEFLLGDREFLDSLATALSVDGEDEGKKRVGA